MKGHKPTLREQIVAAELRVQTRLLWLNEARITLAMLKEKRKDCLHEFSVPLVNHEHEGRRCMLCGINQLETY